MDRKVTTCAHIVPKCSDSEELAYMFGTGDGALTKQRNGHIMHHLIKNAFDDSFIIVLPDDSVDRNPINSKVVLLN